MSDEARGTIDVAVEDLGESGCVARVTVNRPAKINVLDSAMIAMLTSAFESLASHERLRVAVLAGAGDRAFIGGADIQAMVELTDPSAAKGFITALHHACRSIRDLPVPVVAEIHGYCLGAGLEIAAACDLRICEPGATFGMPEVKVGLPSVIEAALLPRLVGWGRANWLMLTGETIDAERAERWGLVEWTTEEGRLEERTRALVDSIVAAGPRATRLQKRLVTRWEELSLEHAIAAGIDCFGDAFEGQEPGAYMRKFLDRPR